MIGAGPTPPTLDRLSPNKLVDLEPVPFLKVCCIEEAVGALATVFDVGGGCAVEGG
jgi:hypothetical protein